MQSLLDQVLEGPTTRLAQPDCEGLAARELPPGTWGGLFLLYQAHCLATNDKCASKALFYEVTKGWRKVLTFRRRSQHSTCQVCDKKRAAMRHARTFVENARAAEELHGHLSMVWRCRETYWAARQKSREQDNLLTLITDGYDRSKPALPRWMRGQQPKHSVLERIPRTGVQISAVLAHGHGVIVFISEEHSSCGGSYTWDTLFFTINKVWKECCKAGRPFFRSLLDLPFVCVLLATA